MPGGAAVLRRLLAAGLVSEAEVVDGDVSLRDVSRSNSVYLVSAGGRAPVVAKACLGERPAGQGDPAVERAFYRALAVNGVGPADLPVAGTVAVGADLLVLGAIEGATTVELRMRAEGPSGALACLLGAALGRWRAVADDLDWSDLDLPVSSPWVLTVATPDEPPFVAQYPALTRMARAVADEPGLRRRLAELRDGWRLRGVIHGDVRWDNALVVGDRVVLVDWEFADWGDPAWDVAGAVADALVYAVLPLDVAHRDGLLAPEALGRLCGSLDWFFGRFASAYATAYGAPAASDLEAGGHLVPARLVQNAFQLAAHEGASGMECGLALVGLAASLSGQPDLLSRWLG
ncbi:MAG TPA: phosphotransferase, partial [Acidimicrobiales bacterium]|nr:phosphotransferase [Acidimicrobiales bacterium]